MTFDSDFSAYDRTDSDAYFPGPAQPDGRPLPRHRLMPLSIALAEVNLEAELQFRRSAPLLIDRKPVNRNDVGHKICTKWTADLRNALHPLRLETIELRVPTATKSERLISSTDVALTANFIALTMPKKEAKGLPGDLRGFFRFHMTEDDLVVSSSYQTQAPNNSLSEEQLNAITRALEMTREPGVPGPHAYRRNDVNELAEMLSVYLAASGVRSLEFSCPLVSS